MEFRTYFVYFHTFSYKFKVQRTPTEFGLPVPRLACDHAPSLYLCNLFSGGWHDTIFSQIKCKKGRIWTCFWLDRKQYGWSALFRMAKKPPSISCWWFQLFCVASVSNPVIAGKLKREQNKEGRGRGREKRKTLARKPHDSGKRPLIFHDSVHF